MVKVRFIYSHNRYDADYDNEECISSILNKYLSSINLNKDQVYFTYKGNYLSLNDKRK